MAPRISSSALVVMVVPWAKKSMSAGRDAAGDELADAIEHAERGVLRRARDLLDQQLARRGIEQHEVGMGAAHVDAEAIAGVAHGVPPIPIRVIVMSVKAATHDDLRPAQTA